MRRIGFIVAMVFVGGCTSGGATPEERAAHWETTRQQLEATGRLAKEIDAVMFARIKTTGNGEVYLKESAGIDLGLEAEIFLIMNPSSAPEPTNGP